MTYDPTTTAGQVRLLIPDRNPTDYLFSDAEITAFLGIELGNVRLAAALALETAASDAALVDKVVRYADDTQIDGAKAADMLLKRAAALRTQVDRSNVQSRVPAIGSIRAPDLSSVPNRRLS